VTAVPAANQQIRFCTTADGVRLAYATVGKGPPIVRAAHWLTHLEFDLESPVWRPWLEELSRYNTFVYYDQRGTGLSDRDVAEISFDHWVSDLEAVVTAAGLARFALLGSSQGSSISVAYAARHPERVSHLILWGGYARGRLKRAAPREAEEVAVQREILRLGWGRDDPAFRQFFTTQFLPDGTPEQISSFNTVQRLSASPETAVQIFDAFCQIEVSALAKTVRVPTLVLHGREDRRASFDEGRLLASLIPDARFVPLETRNHVLVEQDPMWPRFLAEIRAFIGAGDRPAAVAFPDLTARERDILELLARGLANDEIAERLGITSKTVRNQVSALFDKLGVSSRAQAIVKAREAGLGAGGPDKGP
jgi:pimeloyl-ACP methyl ester carboxylesterase/DNA-binding CsgD family transcriptional regulator